MKRSLSHCLFTAAFALAFTLTFSCSSDGSSGGRGPSKSACVSDELKVSTSTLDDIIAECRVSEEYILSLLPDDDIGSCSKAGLVSGKPIGEIKSDCGVEDIPFASSSSGGKTVGRSSSSNGGNPDPSSSGGTGVCPSEAVKIGDQCWMKKNLDVKHNTGNGYSYCYGDASGDYNENCDKYGRLYNWAAAMNLPSKCNSTLSTNDADCTIATPHQGLCPAGFHVPTDAEWDALYNAVGGSSVAGRKLKDKYGWYNCGPVGSGYSSVCEDANGFSALPGGSYGYYYGDFFSAGGGYWWSASEFNYNIAYFRYMNGSNEDAYGTNNSKSYGFSLRCVKD